MQLVTTIDDPAGEPVQVAHVPDSGRFSFAPTPSGAGNSPQAAVVSVSHPSDVTYRLQVRTAVTRRLIIRITDMPGWHASADGHPLVLTRADGDLLSARVPGGTTDVVLTYQPGLLAVGWVLALVALVVLVGAVMVGVGTGLFRRRRRRRH
jgi:hypothetical protein